MKAAVAALDETRPASAGALFTKVGMTLVSTVGGASGPLFGTFFLRLGGSLGDADTVSDQQFAAALRAALEGVVARGKAEPGDKTMYDALAPAVDALDAALSEGASLADALATGRRGGRDRPRRDHPHAGPQGPGQLPRRAQRRTPGPRRDDGGPADAGGQRVLCSEPPANDDASSTAHRTGGGTHDSREWRRPRGRLAQPGTRAGRGGSRLRDAARTRGADRDRRRPGRDHLRHRRGPDQGRHRAGGRPLRCRRPDGPGERRAQHRAGARPAPGPVRCASG